MTTQKLATLALGALLVTACSGGEAAQTTGVESTVAETSSTTAAPTTTTTLAPAASSETSTRVFDVTDFGALGDAKTNDAPAFQAAVDAAAAEGGTVVVPSMGGQRAYVLNDTVEVPTGVSIVGATEGSGPDVGGPYPWPGTDITGVKLLARPGEAVAPLFRLAPGTTVRGLWITYDQQPLPSDAELTDLEGAYGYRDFDSARSFLIDEHVQVTGPTFYIERGDQVTIEDIVADRYYDFLYMREGGPLHVDRVSLYGYNKGFTIESSDTRNVFTNIDFRPAVGPIVPGVRDDGTAWTWVFGAIASRVDNVGFHLGRSDAFVLEAVSFEGVHTAIRLGAAFEYPILDPLGETFFTSDPGRSAWGQVRDVRMVDVAVGVHLVAPATDALQLSNVAITPGIDDGGAYEVTGGSGEFDDVARQAVMLVEASYGAETNGSPAQVPAVLASNVSVAGSSAPDRYGPAAAAVDAANGRVFLVDGELGMEINGFSLGAPYDESHMIGAGDSAGELSIRIRGYLVAGRPEADKVVEKTGVSVLAGDIVIVEQPPPPPPPTTAPPPETTTTTTTTLPRETSTTAPP